jgi:hypothetical protein
MHSSPRTLVTAGLIFGGLMGPVFAWMAWNKSGSLTHSLVVGLALALSSGTLFALLMLAFARLGWTRKQIELGPSDLLPGERLIDSRLANLIVDPRDFGLRPFALGDLMFLAGLHRKEVVGGALHVTDLRLLFKAHRANRLHGAASIFLPSIGSIEPRSRWPFRRLRVSTGLTDVEFITHDVDGLRILIEQAHAALPSHGDARLDALQQQLPDIAQLQPQVALNALNSAIHHGRNTSDVMQAALTPLAALGGLLASEVFDRGFAQRWAERMR